MSWNLRSVRRTSAFENRAVVTLGMEDGKNNRLVADHLIEHAMRKSPQVGPAPVANPDAVAEGVLGNHTDDALHLIHEIGAESGLVGVIPACLAPMSALASGCLLGAFIRKLTLQGVEVVRLERNRDGWIGGVFGEAAVQFGYKFRGFLPVVIGRGRRGSVGGQKTIEPFGQPNHLAGRQPLNLLLDLLNAHGENLAFESGFASRNMGKRVRAVRARNQRRSSIEPTVDDTQDKTLASARASTEK